MASPGRAASSAAPQETQAGPHREPPGPGTQTGVALLGRLGGFPAGRTEPPPRSTSISRSPSRRSVETAGLARPRTVQRETGSPRRSPVNRSRGRREPARRTGSWPRGRRTPAPASPSILVGGTRRACPVPRAPARSPVEHRHMGGHVGGQCRQRVGMWHGCGRMRDALGPRVRSRTPPLPRRPGAAGAPGGSRAATSRRTCVPVRRESFWGHRDGPADSDRRCSRRR